MEIYIKPTGGGKRIRIPMLPEKISMKIEGKTQSYDVISLGKVKIPKGKDLHVISWSAKFPASQRKGASYMHGWKSPKKLQSQMDTWASGNTKLTVMCTGTSINRRCRIDSFEGEWTGIGDFDYTVQFSEARDIKIKTTDEAGISTAESVRPASASTDTQAQPGEGAAATSTYTVKSGDTLWRIATQKLGSGSRYMEIFNLNTDKLTNPDNIDVGQVLTLPS